jgi:hypothetical protein
MVLSLIFSSHARTKMIILTVLPHLTSLPTTSKYMEQNNTRISVGGLVVGVSIILTSNTFSKITLNSNGMNLYYNTAHFSYSLTQEEQSRLKEEPQALNET